SVSTLVIPAKAGIHLRPLPLHQFAITDSRPCAFRPPSMAAGHFLLLVQEKVTKENTPSAPRRSMRERFAAGERVRLTGHPWPESRIGAIPRAARVRCTRLIRPPFAAALEGTAEQEPMDSRFRGNDAWGVSQICGVVYVRCRR